jgi:RNA polymerase sporulation-specific sigma factor
MLTDLSTQEQLELIAQAKSGDSSAHNALYAHSEKLIVSSLPVMSRGDEDERQLADIDAWAAMLDWNPKKGRSLPSHIMWGVRYSALDRHKKRTRESRMPENGFIYFDDLVRSDQQGHNRTTFHDIIPSSSEDSFDILVQQDGPLMIRLFSEVLDEMEQEILRARFGLDGYSSREVLKTIADRHGTAIQTVSNRQESALLKSRAFLRVVAPGESTYFSDNSGKNTPKYHGLNGPQRLAVQQAVFSRLLQETGHSPANIPGSFLMQYSLHPRATQSRAKPYIINRLIGPDEMIPIWDFRGCVAWNSGNNKRRAKDALEFMVLNQNYIVKTRNHNYDLHFIQRMLSTTFKGTDDANKCLQTKVLGLDDIVDRQKYLLLADITDNYSGILGGEYDTAAGLARDHISKLDDIVAAAGFTERQSEVYAMWLKGDSVKKISKAISYEKPISPDFVNGELAHMTDKIRIAALKRYGSVFEDGADPSELRRQTLRSYHNRNLSNINDRYFRLRLQIVIKEICRENKWDFDDLPSTISHEGMIRLHGFLPKFDYSLGAMINFAFPDYFGSRRFVSDWNVFSDDEGRIAAFENIGYVLGKEGALVLTHSMASRHKLIGALRNQFEGRVSNANRAYVEEHLLVQTGLNGQFSEYRDNRKFLALLLTQRYE